MRELNCVVRPDSRGWCVMVGNRLHGRFQRKDDAVRVAIAEAQKGRAAGLYTTVNVMCTDNILRAERRQRRSI